MLDRILFATPFDDDTNVTRLLACRHVVNHCPRETGESYSLIFHATVRNKKHARKYFTVRCRFEIHTACRVNTVVGKTWMSFKKIVQIWTHCDHMAYRTFLTTTERNKWTEMGVFEDKLAIVLRFMTTLCQPWHVQLYGSAVLHTTLRGCRQFSLPQLP